MPRLRSVGDAHHDELRGRQAGRAERRPARGSPQRLHRRTGLRVIPDDPTARLRELFGYDHAAIAPDIMCVGKALTGGYLTMAAVLCTREIAQGVNAAESAALMHGPTFMANPLAAAVSLASIKLLLSRDWRGEVQQIESELTEGLAPASSLPGVRDVRVLGAIGVVEMEAPIPVATTQAALIERGVWLRPFGRLLYTMPPFVSSVPDIRTIAAAMVDAAGRQ